MDAENWVQLGMLGNNVAMQWYLLSHPNASYPVQPSTVDAPGVHVAFNSNLLVLGLLAVGAFLILAK